MLIENLANRQTCNCLLILSISIFILSFLFQYRDIGAQILNNISFDTIKSQTNNIKNIHQIFLDIPNACVFDDEDSPFNHDECFYINNNGETGGLNNIFFTLISDEPVDTFRCELRNSNNILVNNLQFPNSSNCKITDNNIQQIYMDLSNGVYTFQVIATKTVETTIDDNNITQMKTGVSEPFHFFVNSIE